MDQLANEGVVFENAFVESSICCVSRASILTGQYNVRHGIQSVDDPLSREQMGQSFPGLLRKAGYRMALLGKYGVGNTRAAPKELCLPADRFDLWYAFQQGPSYSQMVDGKKRYLTSVMEEKAIEFMKETPEDQPFMVYMCLPEPHGQGGKGGPWNHRDPQFELDEPTTPPTLPPTMTEDAYNRPPETLKNSKNRNAMGDYRKRYPDYMATVRDYAARTDLAIGRIRQALREIGRDKNTVVIFASDNGSMWGAHGISGKWNMYEESIRVPTMIYDPRLKETVKGKRDQMVLNIDLAATIIDLAALPVPKRMQGTSLVPVMKDPNTKGREEWYYHHDVYSRSTGKPLPKCEGVRTERWKYIRYKDTDPVQEELFDLKADSKQQNNLAGNPEYSAVLTTYRDRCSELCSLMK
jgi:arylsulfatase A-like enzyme